MKLYKVVKRYGKKAMVAGAGVLLVPGFAMAQAAVTVPAIDQAAMLDSANAVFVVLGVFVAVCLGIKMFRKA